MKKPRNTHREASAHPIFGLVTAMSEDGKGILAQEAQGQNSFVESDTLPTEMRCCGNLDTKALLEAAGMEFLGPVEDDEMFQYVKFPQGWEKIPTDHSMWSNLVDNKGRVRASIFYKAAFYDRSAHMNLSRRFNVMYDYDRQEKDNIAIAYVMDGDKVIHTTKPIQLPNDNREKYEVANQADKAATEWLDTNYPDWQNPGAYWD